MNTRSSGKPIVLITGGSGNIGRLLAAVLESKYHVLGLNRREVLGGQCPIFAADFSSAASLELGL